MTDSPNPVSCIRHATESDAVEIARLFTTLGHPTTAEAIHSRWGDWAAASNFTLVAAKADNTLAGVATLNQMFVLHRPKPVGRITALVVDAPCRGKGIGRALVAAAEDILACAGCGILEITSNNRLVDAHQFYESLGYERTSIRLAKSLDALQ